MGGRWRLLLLLRQFNRRLHVRLGVKDDGIT